MRRTITTLLFLAVGGLAVAAQAADQNQGGSNWQYYAAGQNSYRISDDDEGPAASGAGAQSVVARAVGRQTTAGQEQNALYVADGTNVGSGILQAGYGADCGCNQNSCGCSNGCLSDCMGNCDCSCNAFRLEWLGWFTRGRNTPALVTSSPVVDPATGLPVTAAAAGVIGIPTTSILYGGDPIGTNLRNGGRLTYSHLFNDGITWGTARFWGIEDGSESFAINSGNNPIIGRPFINRAPATNVNAASLIAFPGLATGSVSVLSKNDLIGADAWLSRSWFNDGYGSLDFLAGYQFARLDDSLVINSSSTAGPLALLPGTVTNVTDSFHTQNEFHGGSLGFIGRSYRGAITLEALGKIAIGNMHQAVIVNGVSSTNGAVNVPGGLLTQPTNIGSFDRNRFAFVPELNVNLIYNVSQSWRLMTGYTFIYWNSVVMAGNQIDPNINPTQIGGLPLTGAAVPAPKFQRTDFWVQGISLGGEYRW